MTVPTKQSKQASPKPSSLASPKQCSLAAAALLAHLGEQKKGQKLFIEEDTIWMQVTLKKPPSKQLKVKKIPLPYPNQDGSEVCLITKEPGKDFKAKLKAAGVMNISKVISLSKLRKERKVYKQKVELMDQYDTFLVDDRVYDMVLKTLGKTFNRASKEPLPLCLTYPNLKAEVDKTMLCSVFKIAHGHTSMLRVGHSGLTQDELSANVTHAARLVSEKVIGGPANIRGLYIKSSLSVALPIYQDVSHLKEKEVAAADITAQQATDTPPAAKKSKKRKSKSKASTLETALQTKEASTTLENLPATPSVAKKAKKSKASTLETPATALQPKEASTTLANLPATPSIAKKAKKSKASTLETPAMALQLKEASTTLENLPATPSVAKKSKKKSKASTLETPTTSLQPKEAAATRTNVPATDRPRKTAKRAKLDIDEEAAPGDVVLAAKVAALDKHATESVLSLLKNAAPTPTLKTKKKKRKAAEL